MMDFLSIVYHTASLFFLLYDYDPFASGFSMDLFSETISGAPHFPEFSSSAETAVLLQKMECIFVVDGRKSEHAMPSHMLLYGPTVPHHQILEQSTT